MNISLRKVSLAVNQLVEIKIKGFQGTSLLDFPGRIASLIFLGGCNLSCPFCHNPALVANPDLYEDIDPVTVIDALQQRRKFIDGVVVSGGEPTLNQGLVPFLAELKSFDLLVKLDTNGLNPDMVKALLERQLVDYLAIDLKTSPDRYGELYWGSVEVKKLLETIRLANHHRVETEFRTTCVPGWVDQEVIHGWGKQIKGVRLWSLQQFQPGNAMHPSSRSIKPFSIETLQNFAEIAGRYVETVVLRGH